MTDVMKISIALTSKQIVSLRKAIKTGGYATISEVVREAIRFWQTTQDAKSSKKKVKDKTKKRRPAKRKKSRKKKKC